jgi:tungstate transport system substrate-binding protein
MNDVAAALKKVASSKAVFASRGDDSGTHKKERALWKAAGIDPTTDSGSWYRETGSGMGATLNAGVGMGAYVMTDRATWISFKNKGDFTIAVEGDKEMFNQYGVIVVNAEKCPSVKTGLAKSFSDWLLSEKGQKTIASYKVGGQQLFFANAKPSM